MGRQRGAAWNSGASAQKIEDQREFVRWWKENVSVRESPGGKDRASNADRRSMLSMAAAEEITGIPQQTVSKWRKRMKDVPAYKLHSNWRRK